MIISIKAEELEEGDNIIIDGEVRTVLDLRENGRMDGVWVEYAEGASRFFSYGEEVRVQSITM